MKQNVYFVSGIDTDAGKSYATGFLDTITRVPDGYRIVASTAEVHVAAYRIEGEPTWAIQFHPEVYHSTDGVQLLRNFVVGICGCAQSWTSESFVETTVRELREKIGDDKVVLGI